MRYPDVVLAEPSLLHYWRLGENGDSATEAGGVDLTLANSPAAVAGFVADSRDALEFESVSPTARSAAAMGLSGYRVFEMWIRNALRASGGSPVTYATIGDGTRSVSLQVSLASTSQWRVQAGYPGAAIEESTGSPGADNDPHHVVVVMTATNVKVYVDAALRIDVDETEFSFAEFDRFQIGGLGFQPTAPYLRADEVAVYSSLSPERIATHYEAGTRVQDPYWGVLA